MDDIHTMVVGFNFHPIKIPFHFNKDFGSEESTMANYYFFLKPEGTRGRHSPYFSVVGLCSSGSKRGFTLVTEHMYRKRWSRR